MTGSIPASSLSTILVNHLILNLHRAGRSNDGLGTALSELVFAPDPILGNIGAPLRDNTDNYDAFEESGDEHELEKQNYRIEIGGSQVDIAAQHIQEQEIETVERTASS